MTKTTTTIVTKNGQIQKNVLRKGLAESSIALSSSPWCLLKLKEVQV